MMFWNGGWGWAWLFMIPMMLIMWAAIALLILPWMRSGRDRPRPAIDLLEVRFTAGEISVTSSESGAPSSTTASAPPPPVSCR